MERRSSRPYSWLRSLPILAGVALLASCAGTASVNGLLVPRGPVPGQRLEEAVVYIETDQPASDRPSPGRADRVSLTFGPGTFGPAVTVAKVGDWLELWNADSVFHQPFSRSPAATFEGRSVRPKNGTAVRLSARGTVQVFCQLHDRESAEVLVLESGAWTRPDTAGAFTFSRLKPGHYVIRSWHPRLGEQKIPLDVDRTGPVTVELRY
jgi:plastocyanin